MTKPFIYFLTAKPSSYGGLNPEDRINRKPDDRKNDPRKENTKTIRPKKMNSNVLVRLLCYKGV